MGSNPDHFTQGTQVTLSTLGAEQRIARAGAVGWVRSKYPMAQIVTVEWDYKKYKDRVHVDFLRVEGSGMGTYYDDEGLHWAPLWWFPWVERARGIRTVKGAWVIGTWYRRAPRVIEESQMSDGTIMQTVKFKDGREQVRAAVWR